MVRVGKSDQMMEESKKITEYITDNFPDAYLRQEYQRILTYHIPKNPQFLWSNIFSIMENGKQQLNIEDYSIAQTSLEQVFHSFTKYQKEN